MFKIIRNSIQKLRKKIEFSRIIALLHRIWGDKLFWRSITEEEEEEKMIPKDLF